MKRINYDENQIAFCVLQQAAWMDRKPGESPHERFARAMGAKGGRQRALRHSHEEMSAMKIESDNRRKAR